MKNINLICFCLSLIITERIYSQQYTMPGSQMAYSGASSTCPFIAIEPYVLNIQGIFDTVSLYGCSRGFDFSGNIPFINSLTGYADPAQIQAWNPTFAATFNPPLSGDYNLNGYQMTNAGFPGRVDKQTIAGVITTMTKYNAGDGTTAGCPRSQLRTYSLPPRTHIRIEIELAFGNPDGTNDWILHPSGENQVLFWQLKSNSQAVPALSANVDTDDQDSTKLMIYFSRKTGGAPNATVIGEFHGLPRHTMIPIVIEAFLDERTIANGGIGLFQAWINDTLVSEVTGPTLAPGTSAHWMGFSVYDWSQTAPYPHNMAIYFKTAKMFVFPVLTISGHVRYANLDSTALNDAKVYLLNSQDEKIDSTYTTIDGTYSFTNLTQGTYHLTSVPTHPWGGVNSTDALLVMKQFVHLVNLDGLYLQAANVNGNQGINSLDALIIAKRFTQIISYFPVNDWISENKEILLTTSLDVSIKVICAGDVNGSYMPSN